MRGDWDWPAECGAFAQRRDGAVLWLACCFMLKRNYKRWRIYFSHAFQIPLLFMNKRSRQTVVLVPACSNIVGNLQHPSHTVQRKYTDALYHGGQCTPLLIPAMGNELDVETLLDLADGLFLSGSASNINAAYYGEAITQPHLPQDPLRDEVTLPLIKAAIARGMPIFGVCRGFQEMNVAMGGTLHQAVHDLPGFESHMDFTATNADDLYRYSHSITLVPDGQLKRILSKSQTVVNSVHGQGINQLAGGLTAQAHANDGLVEAFSIDAHPNFSLAVQWHPEWKMAENPDSMALFNAFGKACQQYHNENR